MFNPSLATYFINQDGIRLELELSEESLESFSDLYPNTLRKVMGLKATPLKDRSRHFFKNSLNITADGNKLVAEVIAMHGGKKVIRDLKTGEILKNQPKHAPAMLYISIHYPFQKPKPKVLKFKHNTSATLGFILYHEKQAVNDYAYLSKTQELHLDWKDSFYTYFRSNTLKRLYQYPIMGYLYLDPRLIRVQTLMRLKDILQFTSYQQSIRSYQLLDKHIKTYFLQEKKIHINEKKVAPNEVNISYFQVSELGLKLVTNQMHIDPDLLFVGVSQRYYVTALPTHVTSHWDYFNTYTPKIPFNIIDPVGPYPSFIYKDTPLFMWKNLIKHKSEVKTSPVRVKTGITLDLPIVGTTKIWKSAPSKQEARKIIEKSLENIRIIFIEKERQRLSKALTHVLYTNQGLSQQKELSKLFAPSVIRGGFGSVKEFSTFNITRITPLESKNGFSVSLNGDVKIIAKHWGHDDNSVLKYQLIIDFVEKEGQWLIKEFSILDLKDKRS